MWLTPSTVHVVYGCPLNVTTTQVYYLSCCLLLLCCTLHGKDHISSHSNLVEVDKPYFSTLGGIFISIVYCTKTLLQRSFRISMISFKVTFEKCLTRKLVLNKNHFLMTKCTCSKGNFSKKPAKKSLVYMAGKFNLNFM